MGPVPGSKAARLRTERHLAGVPEAAAGADAVELDEPDSPLDADFDSVFDSVLVSVPVFFSAGADSDAEPPPDPELELALLGA
jgi:hypothetical protein